MTNLEFTQKQILLEEMQVLATELPAIKGCLFTVFANYVCSENADDTNERIEVTKAFQSVFRLLDSIA